MSWKSFFCFQELMEKYFPIISIRWAVVGCLPVCGTAWDLVGQVQAVGGSLTFGCAFSVALALLILVS